MSIEEAPRFGSPEQISQSRIEQLKEAMEIARQSISSEELSKIDAVIVYGSTALDMANEKSDVDTFIVFEQKNQPGLETIKTISKIMQDALPEISVSFNLGPLVERGRKTKSITVRSTKHPERSPGWVFIHTKDAETKDRINSILKKSQEFWDSVGLNKPLQPKTKYPYNKK